MTPVDPTFIEPRDGDVVVVRASRVPNAELPPISQRRYAVIEWGAFELVSDRMASLPKDEAVLEARHCAAERGGDAWDSTGPQMVRLPRFPLVYRGVGETFAVSIDVTDYASDKPVTVWKSASHLSEAEALNTIVADGVSPPMAKAMIGKAPMPLACS
jgi:hypothetical protein